ncbi:MAG TPA: hypothetical protein VGQ59_14775 [Cyclobacteriaceae bacterium]|jgi:hypothetical protein|nr:hypothetical protein [Cyclobacteriaceae bacterium]
MKNHFKKYPFFYIGLMVVGLWAATPFAMSWLVSNCDSLPFEKWGQIGDMFGATNALFSALTFLGLIITIIRQQSEIKESANQFAEQKAQLQKHHEEQKEQARKIFDEQKEQTQKNFDLEKEYLRKQVRIQNLERFENSFFNLMQVHQQKYEQDGSGIFQSTFNRIIKPSLGSQKNFQSIQQSYDGGLKFEIQTTYLSFVNTFEVIVNFIMSRKRKDRNREKYLKMYFHSITSYEKVILIYYYNFGNDFKHWDYIKFFLFKGLTKHQLGDPDHAPLLDPNVEDLLGKII